MGDAFILIFVLFVVLLLLFGGWGCLICFLFCTVLSDIVYCDTNFTCLMHVEIDMFDNILSKFSIWYGTSYTLNIVSFTLTGLI